jgi:hypothetical protein
MTEETPERDPDEYRFRWTRHHDAYPALTHCPSCGEAVDIPWEPDGDPDDHRPGDPVRCDQCDRDLRLPTYAVKDQLCLLCKVPQTDADEGVAYRRLETGEQICSNCTADLRAFKYELAGQHFVAEYITDDHRRAIIEALGQVAEEYEGEYNFTFNANARYGRMEPDPDEDLTVGDVMEAVDADPEEFRKDLPEELQEKIEVADEGDDEA